MPVLRRLFATVPAIWTAWVLARIMLGLIIFNDYSPRGDVAYYFYGIFGDDPTQMTEYPHAGTWPVELLTALIGDHIEAFYIAFVLMCALFDALFLALILRGHHTNPRVFFAAWFWVFFGTLTGQVFYMRLDIFPSLAVAAAAACLVRWPNFASALLAFATTMKLWPGVLAAGLVGRYNERASWLRLLSFVASIVGLCAITVLTNGWQRLLSPLTYQSDRGLQIESIFATPFVYQAFHEPERWSMGYASSKSFEISGPGVEQALQWSTYTMIAVIVFAVAWALRRFFAGGWQPRSTIAFFAVIILLLVITNKVFSPQYIVWLAPLLAVALRQPQAAGFSKARFAAYFLIVTLAVLTAVSAGLGSYVYPTNYNYIWAQVGVEFAPVAALAWRNLLIVVMALVALCWLALESWIHNHEQRIEQSSTTAPSAISPTAQMNRSDVTPVDSACSDTALADTAPADTASTEAKPAETMPRIPTGEH